MHDRFELKPLSLRYGDPEIEHEYRMAYSQSVADGLVPILAMLIPFVGLVIFIELLDVYDTPVTIVTAALLLVTLMMLYAMARWAGQYIEFGVIATFFAFDAILLSQVTGDAALLTFMPALILVIVMTQCVGLRYIVSLFASAALVVVLVMFVRIEGLTTTILTDAFTFLLPGYAIAASAGYTIERQRRHLFAQVRITEAERDAHEEAALQDPLTGLANRARLQQELAQALARAQRRHTEFAVIFIDLDDFKQINDTWNHAVGDRVLVHIADHLRQQVRAEDTAARIGGDEFVVLSDEISNKEAALISAERVANAVATPFQPSADRPEIVVNCSVGIALCPRDGETIEALMAAADEAMYAAKRAGKGTVRVARVQET